MMEHMEKSDKIILSDIFNAIKTFQAAQGEVEAYGIINAFVRSMKANKNCLVLFRHEMQNGKMKRAFVMMKDKAGHTIFPLFTDMTKILPVQKTMETQGNQVEIGVMGLKELLFMLSSQKLCEGIIVNPFLQNFNAPLKFFAEMLRRDLSSHITLIQANMMELHVDAVVCPTDASISGNMKLESEIREAGGDGYGTVIQNALQGENMETADVTVVQGYGKIHSKYVLFVNTPDYTETSNTKEIFESYLSCMNAAKELKCTSVVFPCTSEAMKGLPMEAVIGASTTAVISWLGQNQDTKMDVYFCCADAEAKAMYQKFFDGLKNK